MRDTFQRLVSYLECAYIGKHDGIHHLGDACIRCGVRGQCAGFRALRILALYKMTHHFLHLLVWTKRLVIDCWLLKKDFWRTLQW